MAEMSLSISKAPNLLMLCQTLATDRKALNEVKLSRWTASYKLNHGVGKHFHEATLADLRENPFSLNIDESTSNNNKRILGM